jgi:hypothetical protein
MASKFESPATNNLESKNEIKGDGQKCPSYTSVVVSLTIARCGIAK